MVVFAVAATRKKKKKEATKKEIQKQISYGLTEIEMKLLRLALDGGASEGDSEAAAVMFVRKLRARNVSADDLFTVVQTSEEKSGNDGGMKVTFGKYRGEFIKNVPINYLVWVLDNCVNISPKLKLAIHNFVYE
jgi:hypothetical protein